MTTYSPSLRFWEGTPGDPAIKNAWGTFLNTNFTLIDSSITGLANVNIAGLTTYSLTTGNGTADQARELMQNYSGALAADCTVTLPNVVKVGWGRNGTTGSHNVLLTSGAGTQAMLPPDSAWYLYRTDGSGNVTLFPVGVGSLKVSGGASIIGATSITGAVSITGAASATTAGTSGNQLVNFSQFGQSRDNPGYVHLPGGLIYQFGNVISDGAGNFSVSFATPFVSDVFSLVASARSPFINGCSINDAPTLSAFSGVTGNRATGTQSGPVHVDWLAIGV